ncbi:MAG: hypothetical protein K0R18_295 [Bacillales bacterium]|jgi:hypothetical protein|nr:hypothetical protein [Bacillales bacterium]
MTKRIQMTFLSYDVDDKDEILEVGYNKAVLSQRGFEHSYELDCGSADTVIILLTKEPLTKAQFEEADEYWGEITDLSYAGGEVELPNSEIVLFMEPEGVFL